MAAFLKQTVFGGERPPANPAYAPLSGHESSASSPTLTAMLIRDTASSASGDSSSDRDLYEKDMENQGDRPPPSSSAARETERRLRISPRVISDAIIGLSDGLTVPFALTAGLSALGNTRTVVYGGFAELIAGAISMGLGGYLGAKSEVDSYHATLSQTQQDIASRPDDVKENVVRLLTNLDVPSDLAREVTTHLSASPKLTDFILHFEHSMPEPPPNRAVSCALTIAIGYFVGGFIPLMPYLFVATDAVQRGLLWSSIVMICTLFVFGYVKTAVVQGWDGWGNRRKAIYGGLEMIVVGSAAAAAAMGLVYAFSSGDNGDET